MRADYTFARYRPLMITHIHIALGNITVLEVDPEKPPKLTELGIEDMMKARTFEWESIISLASVLFNGKKLDSFIKKGGRVSPMILANYLMGEDGIHCGGLLTSDVFEVMVPRFRGSKFFGLFPEIPGEKGVQYLQIATEENVQSVNATDIFLNTKPSYRMSMALIDVAFRNGLYPVRIAQEATHEMAMLRAERAMFCHELVEDAEEDLLGRLTGDTRPSKPCKHCKERIRPGRATQICPVRREADRQQTQTT